jgi:hypothetical protein
MNPMNPMNPANLRLTITALNADAIGYLSAK